MVYSVRKSENKCKASTESLCIIVLFSACFIPLLYLTRFIAKCKSRTIIAYASTYLLALYLL